MSDSSPAIVMRESTIIWIVGLIQFFNILDFVMVMPLGPDFAKALGIPIHDIGLVGGVYTLSAAVSGLIAAFFLDRFSRKGAVTCCLIGLTIATFAAALAWNKESMVAARILAGIFSGPLVALSQSLIADHVAPERRGRAMGKVAGAFAAASVLGVPFGLELASRFHWHTPFIVTGLLGIVITIFTAHRLPYYSPFEYEKSIKRRARHLLSMLQSRVPLMAYGFMFLVMCSGFMIIPNIAAHLQFNLDYPREDMGILYLCGGAVSFFSMRIAGLLVDHYSAAISASIFSILFIIVICVGFIFYPNAVPILLIFTLCMVAISGRSVAAQSLSTKVPASHERGAYMSVQSTVMNLGSAFGAYYSSLMLTEADGKLLGMPDVGMTAIGLSLIIPYLVWQVEKRPTSVPRIVNP